MSTIKAFTKGHPLPTYFAPAFTISLGGFLIVVGRGGFTGATEPTDKQLPFVYLAMFAGPTITGILLTNLAEGTSN